MGASNEMVVPMHLTKKPLAQLHVQKKISKITQINEEIQQSVHSSIEFRESREQIMQIIKPDELEEEEDVPQFEDKKIITKVQTPKRDTVFTKVVQSPPKIKEHNNFDFFRKMNKVPLKLLRQERQLLENTTDEFIRFRNSPLISG